MTPGFPPVTLHCRYFVCESAFACVTVIGLLHDHHPHSAYPLSQLPTPLHSLANFQCPPLRCPYLQTWKIADNGITQCDEAHPSCRNCSKSRRECLGYDPIFKTHSVQSYAANAAYASSTSSSTGGTNGPSTAPSPVEEMISSQTTYMDSSIPMDRRKKAKGEDTKRGLSLQSLCLNPAEEEAVGRQGVLNQRSTMPPISHILR